MAQDKRLTDVDTIAFQGGMDTYHEPGLLAPGSFSALQNMRQMHPGLKQRPGYIKKHSTADSTNGVLSMFQFSKGHTTERHFYAQMSDGDVLEATDAPPTVTTGAFGSEVFDGTSSGQVAASWSVLDDLLIYSNGVDQHQICAGDTNKVQKFIVYNTDTPLVDVPSIGYDYTEEVGSANSEVAVLDSLGNFAACTGTVTCSGTTVTGSGTLFTSELVPGMNINLDLILPQYPPAYSTTYVKATTSESGYNPWNACNPTLPLTGAGTNGWENDNHATNERFHIDIGTAAVITKIYYENFHNSGATTNKGAKTFTFWGSNEASAFAELTYGTDTNWTQLTVDDSTFDEHVAADQADPKYINVTNTTAYRYYAIKIADCWGGAYIGFRRVELWVSDESDVKRVVDTITNNTSLTVTSAVTGHATKSTLTAAHDSLMICTPVMPNKYTFTVSAANGTASVLAGAYYSSTGWKVLTLTDNTVTAGATLAKTGTVTWTTPSDAVPKYMYNTNGFWVRLTFSAALDSEVEISQITYGSTFNSIQNVWDGSLVDGVEGIYYKASTATYSRKNFTQKTGLLSVGSGSDVGGAVAGDQIMMPPSTAPKSKYFIYGTTAIDISAMHNTDDYVYFNFPDPIVGFYIDMGATPNTTTAVTIDAVEYLAPSGSWTSVGTFTDDTDGLAQSGFVTFGRQTGIKPTQFNGSTYNSYWYRFGTGGGIVSASITIGIQGIPYYDINDFGVGICNAVWNHRAVYAFDKYPNWIILSASNAPQVLSSSESGMFRCGDGRQNKICCMKNFYDALLIFQEEKGAGGGCVSLLTKSDEEGAIGNISSVSTYYGTMNANCVEVIETIEGGHKAFFLSRNGVMMTDGKSVSYVPNFDKIKNYFDTTDSDCIRTGYESKMYLKYDSVFHVLKIGLTTGASATNNNVFLVYDLHTSDWSLDSYANNFQCECEADAGSGNAPVVRLAGGQADGTVYILNSGMNDITSAVSSFATMELSNKGKKIRNCELVTRVKTQTAGNMTIDMYRNGVNDSSKQLTRSLTAERTNDRIRKHRDNINWVDQNLSVKFAHSAVDEGFYLLDYGVKLDEYSEQ
jgi:hypothetical protein